jgi:hypothetical protein
MRQLLQTVGIPPNSVTLAALLLLVTEAAALSKVALSDVVAALREIDQLDTENDLEPEQQIAWPVN